MADSPLSRWLREEMPKQGYPLEGPRAGGTSRLADDAGISRAAMSRIINGQGDPSPDSLRRIGKVLGKTLGEMMVIAGLAEAEEVGQAPAGDRPLQVIENPHREPTIEEEVEGFRDATEAAIAAVEHAPRSYRLSAILAYRIMQEEAARNRNAQEGARSAGRGS